MKFLVFRLIKEDVVVKFLDKIRIKSIVLSLVDSIDLSFEINRSINMNACRAMSDLLCGILLDARHILQHGLVDMVENYQKS